MKNFDAALPRMNNQVKLSSCFAQKGLTVARFSVRGQTKQEVQGHA